MAEQATNATNQIVSVIFQKIIPDVVIIALLISAIIFAAKFIKKSNIKHGNLIFITIFAFLAKELLVTLSDFLQYTFLAIMQGVSNPGNYSTLGTFVSNLNSYNVYFIVSALIVLILFLVLKIKKHNVNDTEEETSFTQDLVHDEEIVTTEQNVETNETTKSED